MIVLVFEFEPESESELVFVLLGRLEWRANVSLAHRKRPARTYWRPL